MNLKGQKSAKQEQQINTLLSQAAHLLLLFTLPPSVSGPSAKDPIGLALAPAEAFDGYLAFANSFVSEILSVPDIAGYLLPLLREGGVCSEVDFKRVFQAYLSSKKVKILEGNVEEEEKHEVDAEVRGNLLPEGRKSEKKMFVFSNTLELLFKHFLTTKSGNSS